MLGTKWQVHIDTLGGWYKVYVFTETKNGYECLLPGGIIEKIPEGGFMEEKYYFKLSRSMMAPIIEALSSLGIRTENEYKISGTLEATKYHLEDLRTLLKLHENHRTDKNPE